MCSSDLPERLWAGWVGERVAVVDMARVLENIFLEKDDVSWGPNNTFQFPKYGGTGAIWRSLAKQIGENYFQFNTHVQSIDWQNRTLTTQEGEHIAYDHLLSTMPLDVLGKMLTPTLEGVVTPSSQLLRSHSHIIGVGLKGEMPPKLAKKCWMYFPEDNCPFYRVTVFSHYSPNNVPEPETGKYWSLMTETSESTSKIGRAHV